MNPLYSTSEVGVYSLLYLLSEITQEPQVNQLGDGMYKKHTISVVVPAYKEETQIGKVIETMPDYVDKIIIIDDKSPDKTSEVVQSYIDKGNKKVVLIRHEKNQGVGGAIATGYKWARDNDMDAAVVMAGDGQMDPVDMPDLLDPIIAGKADYTKANRLLTESSFKSIPKIRFLGNSALSFMTKIASGYWHVMDSQTGYTVVNKRVLHTINWDKMFKRYGQPNDLLTKLNVFNFVVKDVPQKPVYDVGEKSGINIRKVVFSIGWLLVRLFFWRMREKYIYRDFHPLVLFYTLAFMLFIVSGGLFVRMIVLWVDYGHAPQMTVMALFFSSIMWLLCTFFAMWMDMDYNKDLKG